ncbi:MAG: thiamine-phosphate kinase [Candidatus Dormibacteria bacterium]
MRSHAAAPADARRHPGCERTFDDPGRPLDEVGESGLLDRLRATSGIADDDAATWAPAPGRSVAVSIDALVEDVDFRRSWTSPHQLGRRAFAVAASDLAGTGATARRALLTLCARRDEAVENLVAIAEGMGGAAREHGGELAGGDVSAIDGPLVIDVCVLGEVEHERSLRRDAGHPGDILVVTGSLGRAAAGLRLLRDSATATDPAATTWVAAQLEPVPRLGEGVALASAGVRCGGDVSDGLAIDAARTARASGCAAELWVDALPVDAELRTRYSQDWLQLAVAGGEDFELLAAVAEAAVAPLLEGWPHDLAPLSVVGRLVEGSGLQLLQRRGGAPVAVPAALSRHFEGPA